MKFFYLKYIQPYLFIYITISVFIVIILFIDNQTDFALDIQLSLALFPIKFFKELNKKESDHSGNKYHRNDDIILNNIDNNIFIVYQIDKDLNLTWANSNVLKEYPNAIGKKCHEIFGGTKNPCGDCICMKSSDQSQITKGIQHFGPSNGLFSQKYWDTIAIPISDKFGSKNATIIIAKEIIDLAEHKKGNLLDFQLNPDGKSIISSGQNANLSESILDELDSCICITDNLLSIVQINKSFKKVIGFDKKSVINKNIFDILKDLRKLGLETQMEKPYNGISIEIKNITLLEINKPVTFDLKISPLFNNYGKITNFLWKFLVIAPLSMIEKELEETLKSYQVLFNESKYGTLILDDNFKVREWNQSCNDIFQWSRDEVLGVSNPVFSASNIQDLLKIKHPDLSSFETKTKRKDGSEVNIQYTFKVLHNNADLFNGIIFNIIDITDLNQFNQNKTELDEKYNSIISNFQGVSFKFDPGKNPVFLNGAVNEITGYSEGDFINGRVTWDSMLFPEDRIVFDDIISRMKLRTRSENDFEYRITRKDGTIKWIHQHFKNIIDDEGNQSYIEGIIYDITQRKDVEEELKHSREQYRNLALYHDSVREEEKKKLAIEIHDELGHALTALKLELAWLLKKKFIRQEVLFEKVRQMNEFIDGTIRKVRTISSQLRPSVLDHFGIVAALEWQASEFQKRSAVRCKLVIQHKDIKLNEQKKTAIFRFFQEVLTNIARHAHASRVDVNLEIVGKELILRVNDNGRGIKQEQINNKKSLGLLGMFERANAIGGKVSISGVIGVGTTIVLSVPLTEAD